MNCEVCLKPNARFMCGKCNDTIYCSTQCQTYDWTHENHSQWCTIDKKTSKKKWKKMAREKKIRGHKVTPKQRRFFYWMANKR